MVESGTSSVEVVTLFRDQAEIAWPYVELAYRETARRYPVRRTRDELLADLLSGKLQVWLVIAGRAVKCCLLTKVVSHDSIGRVLQIVGIGGHKMSQWQEPMLEALKGFAREQSCGHIAGGGRRGWQRSQAAKGFFFHPPDWMLLKVES